MASDKKRKSQIVVMDEHFLYLPLYYARSKQFFGFVPDIYDIEIIPSAEYTDDSAFQMLMDTTSGKNAQVDFAVADPTTVLRPYIQSEGSPAVLASLISNTAFWAIDRRSHQIFRPADLVSFTSIIAFKPGTTSYSIAQLLFRDSHKTTSIISVNPKQELVALKDRPGTVAISPDILGIEHLLYYDQQFNIDLSLGTTQEFNNVFMTALLSRRDVVESDDELVIGLLKALQLSLFLVKAEVPELIEYASGRFNQPRDRITSALKRAAQSNVFSMSIEVTEGTWMNAARILYEGSVVNSFGASEQIESRRIFQSYIQPYLYLARKAVSEISSQVQKPSEEKSSWKDEIPLWAEILLWVAMGAVVARWCHWSGFAVLAACFLIAKVVAWKFQLKPFSFVWWRHWGYSMGFKAVFLAWLAPDLEIYTTKFIPITLGSALLLAELQVVNDEYKKLKGMGL